MLALSLPGWVNTMHAVIAKWLKFFPWENLSLWCIVMSELHQIWSGHSHIIAARDPLVWYRYIALFSGELLKSEYGWRSKPNFAQVTLGPHERHVASHVNAICTRLLQIPLNHAILDLCPEGRAWRCRATFCLVDRVFFHIHQTPSDSLVRNSCRRHPYTPQSS